MYLIYKNTIFEGIFQLKDRIQQTIKNPSTHLCSVCEV